MSSPSVTMRKEHHLGKRSPGDTRVPPLWTARVKGPPPSCVPRNS